ncbi:uncharacterized protein [Apostichopus japonicus]|uniref:uncharacterized protein n=1 Tax=Stichopus japonicus TaxID=307972 RepID=UPI003AB16C7D
MAAKHKHDPIFIVLIIAVVLVFILTMVSNAVTQAGGSVEDGSVAENRTFLTEINPAPWAFAIWGPIYLWMACWIVYVIVCIFKTNSDGPVYLNPPVINYGFLSVYTLNLAISIGWLFAFAADAQIWSLVCLIGLQVTLYIVMICYYIPVKKYTVELAKTQRWNLLCLRILVQNGVALYASWCTVASLLGFTIVLVHLSGWEQAAACCFSLSILSLELILYFIFDLIIFDKYTRYTFTTYPTVMWALIAIIVNNFEEDRPHMVFAIALLCTATIMCAVKVVVSSRRCQVDPLDVDPVDQLKMTTVEKA